MRIDSKQGMPSVLAYGSVLLLAVLIVTGIVLELQYVATEAQAHATAVQLRNDALLGKLVRIHYWGSAGLILCASVLVGAMLWSGSYAKPHRVAWIGAVLLMLGALGLQITGNLMPLDAHDVQTAVVESSIASQVPLAGGATAKLMLRGDTFTERTLTAWHFAHEWLLPVAVVVGAFILLLAFRRSGSRPSWLALLPTLAVLAVAMSLPSPTGIAATQGDYASYDATVSWYVWPMHGAMTAMESLAPGYGWVGSALLPGLLVGFLLLLPLVQPKVAIARTTLLAFLVIFGIASLTHGGPVAPISGPQEPARSSDTAPAKAIDSELARQGRELFNKVGCVGCHGRDGAAPKSAPRLTKVWEKHSDAEWYMRFIRDPKQVEPDSIMPAFPKLSDEELRALAEFLRNPKR